MYRISVLVTFLSVFNLRYTIGQEYFGVPFEETNDFNIWDEEFINDDPNTIPHGDVSALLCDQYDITLNDNAVNCNELKFVLKSGKIGHHLRKRDVEDVQLEGSGTGDLEYHETEATTPEPIVMQTEATTINIQPNAAQLENKTNENIVTPNTDQTTTTTRLEEDKTTAQEQITPASVAVDLTSVETVEVSETSTIKVEVTMDNLETPSTEANVEEAKIAPILLKENIPEESLQSLDEDNELIKIEEDEANPILLKEAVVQEEDSSTSIEPENLPDTTIEPELFKSEAITEEPHETTIKPELYETQTSVNSEPFALQSIQLEANQESNLNPSPVDVSSTVEEQVVTEAAINETQTSNSKPQESDATPAPVDENTVTEAANESSIAAKSEIDAVEEEATEQKLVTEAATKAVVVEEHTEASKEQQVVTEKQLEATTKQEHEELVKVHGRKSSNEAEKIDTQQSSNVVVNMDEHKAHGSNGVEIKETDKTIMNMATGAEIKAAAPANEPNTGESSRDVQKASKDTTVLIVLFTIVLAVGALAISYNYVQKRKRRAANAQVRNGHSIKRSLQDITNNGKSDIEKGTEMKPLMIKDFKDNATVEKINEK